MSYKHDKKIVNKILEETTEQLERLQIQERFETRKAVMDVKMRSQAGNTQARIKILREYINFLEEIENE